MAKRFIPQPNFPIPLLGSPAAAAHAFPIAIAIVIAMDGNANPVPVDPLGLHRCVGTKSGHPPSSSPKTRRTGPAGAATGTRVRQSVLYADHPRRSRGRRGRALSPTKSLFEEHAGEVSSSELAPTFTDLSKFEAMALHDTPPAFESTDGAGVYAGNMGSGAPDSTIAELLAVEEPLSPRSERIQKIELYMAEHTYYDLREALAAVANGFRDPPKPKEAYVPDTEPSKAKSSPHELDVQSFQTPRQTSEAPKVSECLASPTEDLAQSKESTEEIIQNGKRWMSEEVMLAFEKYIEGRDEFKEMMYGLDELQYQCFNVEIYHKIFHHYNFTVKMKKPTSDDWSSTLYFAEVKEMYGVKFYFCCALEPSDDGYCHACKNQGMDALRHPADHVGFEIGQADMECPFFYMSDSDDDMVPIHYDGLAFERVFCRYVE